MEEGRYWMWTKSIHPRLLRPPPAVNFSGDSWEEQAFADDAGVWPPRSYSCTFCRRDFRSAQALGGHMNVHRRDRARLKQSPNPAAEVAPQTLALNPCTSQISTLFFTNPNPNFSVSGTGVFRVSSPPPSPPFKVSCNKEEKVSVSSNLGFFLPNPPPWSSFLSEKRDRDDEKKSAVANRDSSVEKEDLSLFVCQWEMNTCNDEEVPSFKRRRIEAKPLSFCVPQKEVLKLCSGNDDLDLELRLGDAPKVK